MSADAPRLECRGCGRVVAHLYQGGLCSRCRDAGVRRRTWSIAFLIVALAYTLAAAAPPRFRLEPPDAPAIKLPHATEPVETGERTSPADSRPVVNLYSLCTGCAACDQLQADAQQPGFPVRLELRPVAPAWVTAYPTLHWQGSDGKWYQQVGWRGTADFSARFAATQASAPKAPAAATPAAAALPLVDQFRQFAGDSGTFQFAPQSQITADLGSGANITYQRVSGRYSVSGGVITLVLDQPGPHVDARKFGIHLGATVLGADYPEGGDPKLLGVSTSVKKFRIRLEEVP